MVGVRDVEAFKEELVCRTEGAVVASSGGVRISDVATSHADIWVQELRARLSRWWVHLNEFD